MDENISKMQYLSVSNTKIYRVKDIDFCNLTIEANQTNLSIEDVPESEVFPVEELGEFRIRMCNGDEMGKIIDLGEWMKRNRRDD